MPKFHMTDAQMLVELRNKARQEREPELQARRRMLASIWDHSALTRHRDTAEIEAAVGTEITFYALRDETGFDYTKLPERTHESYMLRWNHSYWLNQFEAMYAASCDGDERLVGVLKKRLRTIPTEFRRPARKAVSKKKVN